VGAVPQVWHRDGYHQDWKVKIKYFCVVQCKKIINKNWILVLLIHCPKIF
jgi:hypothetical protein